MKIKNCKVSSKIKDITTAFAFLAPSLIIFSMFVFFPLIFSLYLSFHKWNLISPEKIFVALKNYKDLFFDDPLFYKVLLNTAIFSIVVVGVTLVLGLIFALILNKEIPFRAVYRAGIFLPYVTSVSAMALVWLWIFDPTYGLINVILKIFGINGPKWLSSVDWALPALIIMTIWRFTGYSMLLYIGGLQNLPDELREAAIVDGASKWKLFWHITFPLLSPTTFFIAITSVITMLKNFETVYVMTRGGPVNSTNMVVFYLYQNAFKFFDVGYASTISIILFVIVVILTAIQLIVQKKWVYYA